MFEISGNLKSQSSKDQDNYKVFLNADLRDRENNSKNRGI